DVCSSDLRVQKPHKVTRELRQVLDRSHVVELVGALTGNLSGRSEHEATLSPDVYTGCQDARAGLHVDTFRSPVEPVLSVVRGLRPHRTLRDLHPNRHQASEAVYSLLPVDVNNHDSRLTGVEHDTAEALPVTPDVFPPHRVFTVSPAVILERQRLVTTAVYTHVDRIMEIAFKPESVGVSGRLVSHSLILLQSLQRPPGHPENDETRHKREDHSSSPGRTSTYGRNCSPSRSIHSSLSSGSPFSF